MVKHIVGWSGGKDSSAMLIRMMEEGRPIDDIVFIEVMATPALGGELPEMYEYIQKWRSTSTVKLRLSGRFWTSTQCFITLMVRAGGQGVSMDFLLQSGPGAMAA